MRSSCALSLNILFDESSGCESLHGVKSFFTNTAIYKKVMFWSRWGKRWFRIDFGKSVFVTKYWYRILLVNWFLIFVDTCGVNRSVECVLQCVTARPLSVLKIQLIANDVYNIYACLFDST